MEEAGWAALGRSFQQPPPLHPSVYCRIELLYGQRLPWVIGWALDHILHKNIVIEGPDLFPEVAHVPAGVEDNLLTG